MRMLFPKHFPYMLLWIEFRAVTWPMVQLHFIAPLQHKVSHCCTFVLWCAVNNEYHITIGRRAESCQESKKRLLREIIQPHPVAKAAQSRDSAEDFDTFVAPKGGALWCFPHTCPCAPDRALCRQRHFVFKENGGRFLPSAARNLRFDLSFPTRLCRGISKGQHALRFLHTEATRAKQFGARDVGDS